MGVNPSKSGDFIRFPLPSSPIFACKSGCLIQECSDFGFNILKINYINNIYVIEVAKP